MRIRCLFFLVLLVPLVAESGHAQAAVSEFPERFDYRWSLAGFKGALARIFVPGQGEGRLVTDLAAGTQDSERLVTELHISSRDERRDEFWLYGAEIDAVEKKTLRAWSAQRFRGKSRRKERDAEGLEALDLASAIYYLRRELPEESQETMIWSSGRLNPIVIDAGPRGSAELNGRQVSTRSYSIRGLEKPGMPTWEGMMDLVLTDDDDAVPLEIQVMKKGLRVRLELIQDDPQG